MRAHRDQEILRDLYLCDIYVLEIRASRGVLAITVEFALAPEHPAYTSPRPGEQYCYLNGVLLFEKVTDLSWSGQLSSRPSQDPDGSIDYGNIDALTMEGTRYMVHGDLGAIELRASTMRIVYSTDGSSSGGSY